MMLAILRSASREPSTSSRRASRNASVDVITKITSWSRETKASALGDMPGGGESISLIGAVLLGDRPSRPSAHTTTAAGDSMFVPPRGQHEPLPRTLVMSALVVQVARAATDCVGEV